MTDPADKPTRIEVSRLIAASPHEVFAVLRDPRGHVDIDASGMLMDATGEPVGAVGDRFTVHMDRRALGDLPWQDYDVEVVITVFVPDREIAWTIEGRLAPVAPRVRLPARACRHRGPRYVLLRLVRARPELAEQFRLVSGRARERPQSDAGDPRPNRPPAPSRRGTLTPPVLGAVLSHPGR